VSFQLNKSSEAKLIGLHPDLIRVVRGAALHYAEGQQFIVVEGLRTIERQRELFRAGKSHTMNSRHLNGHAVDLAPMLDTDGDGDLDLSWDPKHFYPIIDAMRASAAAAGVLIQWGGEIWKPDFIDKPHWQLPWSKYP
jgi:peptidoglycan L-alanyl-D-glutamate endopeptidase CwlK